MKNLIQIHSKTEGTTSAAMLLLSLSCCRDKHCINGGCRVLGRTLRTMSFVNSGEVASGEMLLITIASDDLASDDVSLGALSSDSFLQTHFFRRISSDAFVQTL